MGAMRQTCVPKTALAIPAGRSSRIRLTRAAVSADYPDLFNSSWAEAAEELMTPNENLQIVERAFAQTAQGDGRAFVDMLADDATWRIIGTTAWSRTYIGKTEILTRLLTPLRENFAVPNLVTAQRIRASDNWVVVEARGRAETNGHAVLQ